MGGVHEFEEHDHGFKKAFVCDEDSLPLMSIIDSDAVVAPSDAKLSEDFSSFEFVHKIRDEGKGIGISNSMFVQIVVVLAGAKTTILFLDDKEECGLRGV